METYNETPLSCKVWQQKDSHKKQINEIISREEAFQVNYICTFQGKEYKGTQQLFSYPFQIPYLALGHVVNDCLPFIKADYEVSYTEENHSIHLNLKAKEKEEQKPLPIDAFPLSYFIYNMSTFLGLKGNWDGTGCFHRAGILHPISQDLIKAEDIGRHNCVDRLTGYCILHNLNLSDYFVFITARITASLYHKLRKAGFSTLISRSAITSEAYTLAVKDNITLAGFCRPDEKRITVFHDGKNVFV